MSQTTQEEGDTNEGITTVMALWIDNSTIAFTTDDSVNILHLGSNIHLAYGRSTIRTTMLLGYITEGTGR